MKMGLVREGHSILLHALYGLRSSPKRWEVERDKKLTELRIKFKEDEIYLKRSSVDRSLWKILRKTREQRPRGMDQTINIDRIEGYILVYVDDFLVTTTGDMCMVDLQQGWKNTTESLARHWAYKQVSAKS